MKWELTSLILNSSNGRLAHSTWKTILGISVGVGLILFITAKLDSFIINMEDYMLSIMPEVQFQRTKNSMPTQLKPADVGKLNALLDRDKRVLEKGPAFFQFNILQFKSKDIHINKRSLVVSGLIVDHSKLSDSPIKNQPPLLLDIANNLTIDENLATVLNKDSWKVVISSRLGEKLFGNESYVGRSFWLGNRLAKESELMEVTVAGVYVNASVNAVFMSQEASAQLTGNSKAIWANTYIVRLKNKYQSKEWRQELIDNISNERDLAGYRVEQYQASFAKTPNQTTDDNMENRSHPSAEGAKHQQEFRHWKDRYTTAKDALDFLKPFQIQSWMDVAPENLRHLKMTRVVTIVILSAVLVLTAVSIKFLFDTIVIEKRRQIATLKAIGFGNRSIMISLLSAGLFIGVMGVVIGSLLGVGLNSATASYEAIFFQETFHIQYRNVGLPFDFVAKIGAVTVILSLISAFFPMRSTLKIQPIEGIRREG